MLEYVAAESHTRSAGVDGISHSLEYLREFANSAPQNNHRDRDIGNGDYPLASCRDTNLKILKFTRRLYYTSSTKTRGFSQCLISSQSLLSIDITLFLCRLDYYANWYYMNLEKPYPQVKENDEILFTSWVICSLLWLMYHLRFLYCILQEQDLCLQVI